MEVILTACHAIEVLNSLAQPGQVRSLNNGMQLRVCAPMRSNSLPPFLKRFYAFIRLHTRTEWVLWIAGLTLALAICSIAEGVVTLSWVAGIVIKYWRTVLHGIWDAITSLFLDLPVSPFVKDQVTVILILTGFIARAHWAMGSQSYRAKSYTVRTAMVAGFGCIGGLAILIALVEFQNWSTLKTFSSSDGLALVLSLFAFLLTYILAVQKAATFTNVTIAALLWRGLVLAIAIMILDHVGRLIARLSATLGV